MICSEVAHAKLNLALHVRYRRADGYHDLETIFAFAEVGDIVGVVDAGPPLEIEGPFGSGLTANPDNLVLKAVAALRRESGATVPVSLKLQKNLPVASGIGGGSADAAATLRLLNRHWQLHWPLARLAALGGELGADVAACVWNCTQYGAGKGDVLRQLPAADLAGQPVLLVNPSVAVSTAEVFRAWDRVDHGPLTQGDVLVAARAGRNDLERSAMSLQPVISDVLAMLSAQAGAGLVRMSGSGATCFALFRDQVACVAAAAVLRAAQPGWWVMPTRLV